MKKIKMEKLDLNLFHEKLENGLDVYILPKNNVNNIYATFSTKYGSNIIEFTPLGQTKMKKVPLGIAHFLEHKMFEQKDGIDPFTFYSERGADANAFTDQKKTTYLFSGPSFLEENLNYLLDYVQEPYFTDKNVEKEKGIIVQEATMYQDMPDNVMYESLLANCFHEHPMKYPIIGTIKDIKYITKEDLYDCYNTFYHPSNMFLIVTGNIDPEEVLKIVKENQSKKEFSKPQPIKIKEYKEKETVVKKEDCKALNVAIPKIGISYKIKIPKYNLYQFSLYLLTLFDIKLGSTSLFIKNAIEDKITNQDLGIYFDLTKEYVIVSIFGETEKPQELIDKIKDCIKEKDFNEKEFNRKKKTLISSLLYMSDNIFTLNDNMMNDIIRYGKINENRYQDIKDLNFDDFIKIVKQINLENMTTFVVNSKRA